MEVIVVNDGSDQDVRELLGDFRSHVRCVDQPHLGPAAARNRGVDLASHSIIGFLDADDTWTDGSVRCAFETWEQKPESSAVHGLTRLVVEDEAKNGTSRSVGSPWRSPQVGSILLSRHVAQQLRFDEMLTRGEDLDWVVRLRERERHFDRVSQRGAIRISDSRTKHDTGSQPG